MMLNRFEARDAANQPKATPTVQTRSRRPSRSQPPSPVQPVLGPPPPTGYQPQVIVPQAQQYSQQSYQPANFLRQFQSFVRNPFPTIGNLFRSQVPAPYAPQALRPYVGTQSQLQPYYQVQPTDVNMSSVANNLGVPLLPLVQANGGIKTLPPTGSYISTGFQTPQTSNYTNPYANQYQPSVQQPGRGGTPPQQVLMQNAANVLDNMAKMQGYVPDSSLIPRGTVIPIDMWNASGRTPQDAQALGLQVIGYNLVATGTAPQTGGAGPNRYTGAPGTPGNRGGVAIRNIHGTLVNASMRHRQGYGRTQAAAAAIADNASATAQTVLSLRLGSG